jgi:hypothetical protein
MESHRPNVCLCLCTEIEVSCDVVPCGVVNGPKVKQLPEQGLHKFVKNLWAISKFRTAGDIAVPSILRIRACQAPLNKIYLCIPVLEPEDEGDTIRRNVWRYSITSQKTSNFFSCALRISNPAVRWRYVAMLSTFRLEISSYAEHVPAAEDVCLSVGW